MNPTDPRLDYGRWLRIPGPTPLPPAVREALGREMLPHRAGDMLDIVTRIQTGLQAMHRSSQPVLFWPGTGSAGWEIAIVNLLSPGDTVLATIAGHFGLRWANVAEQLGLDVRRLAVEWGQPVLPEQLREALAGAGDVKAVLITHNETATGVTNPLADLAAVARDAGAYVLVDAVSSAAALPLEVDAWGLDWVISGTQKAWMCPPGLVIAAPSARAMAATKDAGYPRFFFDAARQAEALANGSTATTAPESMLFALDAALAMMMEEGTEAIQARHRRLGDFVRGGLTELGLGLLANPAYASNTVTAFHPPAGETSQAFQKRLAQQSGVELAVGQGDYTAKILRVGHMGWVGEPELAATLEAIGAAMAAR